MLDWAAREEKPLLERMRYLSIVSSNLTNTSKCATANLLAAAQEHAQEGEFTEQGFLQVNGAAHALVER